ncbi:MULTISPECIES: hypothetical protein [Sinorhizobium]|uniref:hypothetical protein n=1 Tax=Sinorhizobium TaxID=28105 RepID=UPI000D4C1D0C|nr:MULTISPECIES: hypothetical protein [Sinorhizobium]POH33403.1 hypothetical protein ATY30_02175 [Sinorhizobium americanum]
MTADFNELWKEPDTPSRERKGLMANIIEVTLSSKLPAEETTKPQVSFKREQIETATTMWLKIYVVPAKRSSPSLIN